MKKISILLVAIMVLVSCGEAKETEVKTEDKKNINQEQVQKNEVKKVAKSQEVMEEKSSFIKCGANTIDKNNDSITRVFFGDEKIIEFDDGGYSGFNFLCEKGVSKFYDSYGAGLLEVFEYIEVNEKNTIQKKCEYMHDEKSGELLSTVYTVNKKVEKKANKKESIKECEDIKNEFSRLDKVKEQKSN